MTVEICPACQGSGEKDRKVEFRNGAILERLPDVTPQECDRCSGDGVVYRKEAPA